MPELEQETGRQGVARVKRLLEAFMRFNLHYDAYQHAERVSLVMLTGQVETYDLTGDHLDDQGQARTLVFVESKNVKDAAGQGPEFERFLAQAYSAMARQIDEIGIDPKYEFMWATTCPWKGTGFRYAASKENVRKAVAAHLDGEVLPKDHTIDQDLIDRVADRVWLWVVAERHDEMSPTDEMRGHVLKAMIEAGS